MIKLIIFDVDGTLVDAYKAVEESLNFTLRKLGCKCLATLHIVRRSVGWGDRHFMRMFVGDDILDSGLRIYRKHHQKSLLKYSRIIPGTKAVLEALRKRGYKLAVASNRPKEFTMILLRHLKLDQYFDIIVCAKGRSDIKPKPTILLRSMKRLKAAKHETLYVGDMVIDVLAGRNAGVRTVAVLGGSSFRSELKKARPYKIIGKLSGVIRIAEA